MFIAICVTMWLIFVIAKAFPIFEPFNIHEDGAIAQRWHRWIKLLKNLFFAAAISDKKGQRALLL